MKKVPILIFIALLIFPFVSAINISIEKQSSDEVLVSGLDKPVIFDLKITNLGPEDDFEFYNLLGFTIFPVDLIFSPIFIIFASCQSFSKFINDKNNT